MIEVRLQDDRGGVHVDVALRVASFASAVAEGPAGVEAMLKMSDRVSDLNFSVGRQPQVEIDGTLVPVNFPGLPRLTPYQTEMIAMHMLRGDRELTRTLVQSGSVDLSYSIPQKTRFRVNVFAQRGTYAIVLRVIPEGVPTLDALKLPKEI